MNLVLPGSGILEPLRGVDGLVLSRKCTQFDTAAKLLQSPTFAAGLHSLSYLLIPHLCPLHFLFYQNHLPVRDNWVYCPRSRHSEDSDSSPPPWKMSNHTETVTLERTCVGILDDSPAQPQPTARINFQPCECAILDFQLNRALR